MLESNLRSHVYTLAGEIGERNVFHPAALRKAAEFIENEWNQQGYEVNHQEYSAKGVECANLEISRTGTTTPKDILLIGAHYDSVYGSPGGNDNASGVAALLEISRAFQSVQPKITTRFVAFVNEEPPFFMWRDMGSLVYARAAKKRGERIRLMVSLEMLGFYSNAKGSQVYPPLFKYFYPAQANFIAFVSNFRSRRMMLQVAQAFRQHSTFPLEHVATFAFVPGVANSDHLSFWRQGYKAFMITDTAYNRYAYYHTAEDTPEKICYSEFSRVTEGLIGAFIQTANHQH